MNEHPSQTTSSAPRVAEIVHFRLTDGVSAEDFLAATEAMQTIVAAYPGYISRRLSQNTDGSWTDYVVWSDLDRAQSAAREIFNEPVTKPFMEAIDGSSVQMRHERIVMQTG